MIELRFELTRIPEVSDQRQLISQTRAFFWEYRNGSYDRMRRPLLCKKQKPEMGAGAERLEESNARRYAQCAVQPS